MPTGTFHTADDVRRSIMRLTEELDTLSRQREYLLSQAIPKLEHEYLYCINSLEQEAVKLEGELFRLTTIISFYESALQNNVLPQHNEIASMIRSLSEQWSEQAKKFKYVNPDDQSVIPMLQYERDEIASHFHRILQHITKYSLNDGTEHYTYLLRRVSESYRSGNIGELRALRVILEGKIASLTEGKKKKSLFRKLLDWVKYRF
ncbi:MAG: hypothetical protein WCX28_00875 [Bacteriovoracaceae bacterium]|nr:hypothetical protein [Bacteroidota bacterium]